MIITECPYCDRPHLFAVGRGQAGVYAERECDAEDCPETFVVDVTRIDGTTYPLEEFRENELPEMDDVERVEHPDGDTVLYCNPDKLTWT